MFYTIFTPVILLVSVVVFCGQPVFADDKSRAEDVRLESSSLSDPFSYDEMETFLDNFLNNQLETEHIQGAVVSVVKGGDIFFTRGYGYSDLENIKPVIADKTLFRIGSVSKLFTWTAIMQLVENGKLDLHLDINSYLTDFQIPSAFSEPITLFHLLTHTHGLANRVIGTEAKNADDLLTLKEAVITCLPERVRPPGRLASYSDYSAALGGYIIEQVSGLSFQQYMQEYIFEPLGMHNSTFQQPLPNSLASNLSLGYTCSNGNYIAGEFQFFQLAPANAMSVTATDISKFMIAHLQNGLYGNNRILEVSTANDMQRQQFTHDSHLSGLTYGFIEMKLNNERIIGHTGEIRNYSTLMVLLPDRNIGLFASYNSANSAPNELLHGFLDHFYPTLNYPISRSTAEFPEHVKLVKGFYRPTSNQYTDLEKVGELLNLVRIDTYGDGALLFKTNASGIKRGIEITPWIYLQINGQNALVFKKDSQEHDIYMFNNYKPYTAFVKLRWYETPVFHGSILVICLLVFLSVILRPSRAFYIRRRRNNILPPDSIQRLFRCFLFGTSGLSISFVVGCLLVIANPQFVIYGLSASIYIGLSATILITILTAGAILLLFLFWGKGYYSITSRIYYTMITLAAVTFIWQLDYFQLLGFHL